MSMARLILETYPHVSLKFEPGWYGSSETRLVLGVTLSVPQGLVDHEATSLADNWTLWIYDGSASSNAPKAQHGLGSITVRPPASRNGVPTGCVVHLDLSPVAFASLLAACLAGKMPSHIYLEIDGLPDDGAEPLCWDWQAQPQLEIASANLDVAVSLP